MAPSDDHVHGNENGNGNENGHTQTNGTTGLKGDAQGGMSGSGIKVSLKVLGLLFRVSFGGSVRVLCWRVYDRDEVGESDVRDRCALDSGWSVARLRLM